MVAAGASVTQGTLGADWVGALRNSPEFRRAAIVNAGINGNTGADLRQRVDSDIVASRPDRVVVLIGTNDVRADVPVARNRENLRAVIDRLRSATGARIALMPLPPLGEDLDAPINRRIDRYNDAIRETAHTAGADCLPLYEQFADHRRGRDGPGRAYDFSFALAFRSATEHYLFRRDWDAVSHSHGLELFIDHIHLSDRGGAMVTGLVAEWLRR